MAAKDDPELTQLLRRLPEEREDVEDRLLELVQEQLRPLADRLMRRERPDHTLQATVLVDEAWMELARQERNDWQNREQFLALASRAMRRMLVNHARDRRADKRGGGREREALNSILASYEEQQLDVLALHEGLERLAELDERAARVVELRFFGGLSMQETADALGLPLRTAERSWLRARVWLQERLGGSESGA